MRRRDQMSTSRLLRRGGLLVEQMTDRCLGTVLLYHTAMYRAECAHRSSAPTGSYGHDLMVVFADLTGGAPCRLALPFGRGRYLHVHTGQKHRLQEPHPPFRLLVRQHNGSHPGSRPRPLLLLPSERLDILAIVNAWELGHLRASAIGRAFRPLLSLMQESGSSDGGWQLCVVTIHMLGHFIRDIVQFGLFGADDLRSPDGRSLGGLVMEVWFGDPDSTALEVLNNSSARP